MESDFEGISVDRRQNISSSMGVSSLDTWAELENVSREDLTVGSVGEDVDDMRLGAMCGYFLKQRSTVWPIRWQWLHFGRLWGEGDETMRSASKDGEKIVDRRNDRCSSCKRLLFIKSRERHLSSLPSLSSALMVWSNLAGKHFRISIAFSSSSMVMPMEMSELASFRTRLVYGRIDSYPTF